MEKRILITLPRSDDVTEYLSVFSSPIIDACSNKSIRLTKLEKPNKTNFENILSKLNHKMIIFNGHGSPNIISGHKNRSIIINGSNEFLLTNRITYARSCWASSGVGESSMKKNESGCFIGYKIPFMFLIDSTRATNPIKDHIAKIFFDTSNIIPLKFIKGNSALRAHEDSKKAMLKAINKILRKKDKDSQAIAETLWNNHSGQELLGNPHAKL